MAGPALSRGPGRLVAEARLRSPRGGAGGCSSSLESGVRALSKGSSAPAVEHALRGEPAAEEEIARPDRGCRPSNCWLKPPKPPFAWRSTIKPGGLSANAATPELPHGCGPRQDSQLGMPRQASRIGWATRALCTGARFPGRNSHDGPGAGSARAHRPAGRAVPVCGITSQGCCGTDARSRPAPVGNVTSAVQGRRRCRNSLRAADATTSKRVTSHIRARSPDGLEEAVQTIPPESVTWRAVAVLKYQKILSPP